MDEPDDNGNQGLPVGLLGPPSAVKNEVPEVHISTSARLSAAMLGACLQVEAVEGEREQT